MSFRQVSIVGAALSANKGAAAMVETVVTRLPEYVGPVRFALLTTYPADDQDRLPASAEIDVVGLEPLRLALVEFPVALLAYVARKCRLPLGWVRTRANRAILNSDVVVDVAGISFADGRGIPIVVYNTLMTSIGVLLGVPTVKAAQALGPFRGRINHMLASRVLPALATVCARGAATRSHLDTLGLKNVVDVSDLAFSLDEAASLPADVERQLSVIEGEFLTVMPSSVVKGIYEKNGSNYVEAVEKLVQFLREVTGLYVVIVPHSYRIGHGEGRMNDGPVCRAVAERFVDEPAVVAIDADLTAGELRHIVSRGAVLVTSRFHAMISGLATATPTVVVGWSHKYKEVLSDFGLEDFGFDAQCLDNPSIVTDKVVEALEQRDAIIGRIRAGLPAVKERSARNFSVIADVMSK
jgi:polysaccharide pyruvyl transferase WcaK-like protein